MRMIISPAVILFHMTSGRSGARTPLAFYNWLYTETAGAILQAVFHGDAAADQDVSNE
jgi:hypothetical protein